MSAVTFPASARRNATSKIASAPHRKNAAPAKLDSHQKPDRSAERNNPVQQLIKQAVDSLVQQLEAGKSDALTAYLAAMARFHRYSFLCGSEHRKDWTKPLRGIVVGRTVGF